jgi:hypothetical protein
MEKLNNKKGVAGLNVFLSVIAMLFMIGIIVMVFAIAGAELKSAQMYNENVKISNETFNVTAVLQDLTTGAGYSDCANAGYVYANNLTLPDELTSTDLHFEGCQFNVTGAGVGYIAQKINITYTVDYTSNPTARDTINDTYNAVSDSVDWFPTFIVLGAMVVLILLVVIIINSIRGSGLISGEGA